MEDAVITGRAGLFFEELYGQWFEKWPAENRAGEEQRKIVCFFPCICICFANASEFQELFTLCIMALKCKWVENGTLPQGWTQQMAFTKLDQLEEMITRQYETIAHVFD